MILFFRFIYRSVLRHPLRSGLTALSIIVAILAFGMLRTMVQVPCFCLVDGFIGGFLPAARAARMDIIDALRAV